MRQGLGLGISARRAAIVYAVAFILLNVGNLYALAQRPWMDESEEINGWLLLSLESNPATWFSSIALLAAAVAVNLLALTEPAGTVARRRWRQISLIPVVLSLDEVSMFHERMNWFEGGPIHYGWVYSGIAVIAGLALLFGPFVLSRDRETQIVLVVGVACTVGGGIVAESLAGNLDARDYSVWVYQLVTGIEENLELLGVAIVTVGLLHVAARKGLRLTAAITGDVIPSSMAATDRRPR